MQPWTSQPKDIHSLFKDRQLQDVIARLTQLLTHPEFQPRLMRSSYSFRIRLGPTYDLDTFRHSREQSYQQPPHRDTEQKIYRTKRTRRDLQDYPIFVTGNPPDLVRLAIEFGHIPFVDHLLQRGFRPRDLPEYFNSIPFLSTEDPGQPSSLVGTHNEARDLESGKRRDTADSREQVGHRHKHTSILQRSLELTQIWECMRLANQELMDACSRADLDGVLRVLDDTLARPRPTLDDSARSQGALIPATHDSSSDEESHKPMNKGKQRHVSYEGSRRQDSTVGSVAQTNEYEVWESTDYGVGSSSSTRQRSRDQSTTIGHITSSEQEIHASPLQMSSAAPSSSAQTVTHRSTFFTTRKRVDSDVSQMQSPLSALLSPTLSDAKEPSEVQPHMPWIDGRALTSALLAVCFRRDGYESEEAAALEESRAVPIVNEILKYDSMLTAQSLGQAVQAVAYSRPPGSLKRVYDQRQQRSHRQQRSDHTSSSASSRPESVARSASAPATPQNTAEISVMDLLMERIGPREWLKLIKSYLQRREFEDLTVLLELCPFKGPQLETKDKDQDQEPIYYSLSSPRDVMNRQDYYRQQARELICREAGISGVGTRLGHFNGRGIGQSSYNVAATLHSSSRMLFTGSGTRFNNTFMLPRGGFRGIGGNTSGHSSSIGNSSAQGGESAESSFNATEEGEEGGEEGDSTHGESAPFDFPETSHHGRRGQRQPSIDAENGSDDGGDESSRGNGRDMDQDPFDPQDTSLAFGSVGNSTTSSSRPGPGIVGIAIQVQAPDYIMRILLKMGFRFFSICDLSISDARHPLALQFRQQEKMNRLLIDFCMAPNVEPQNVPPARRSSGTGLAPSRGSQNRRPRRDGRRYDPAEQEYYAQAAERFLYPSASNQTRGSIAIPAFSARPSTGITADRQTSIAIGSTTTSEELSSSLGSMSTTTQIPSVLTPSNHLQFILPPVPLGESFEAIAAETEFPEQGSRLSSPPQVTFNQPHYLNSGLSVSMPLPIRTSMIEARRLSGSSLLEPFTILDQDDDNYQEGIVGISAQQRMINRTTKRRVREFLASDYIDLTTVGICIYQACYHKKELLLRILLEHRLLIAQDTLAGAVQVAASVGWKRGLEILLIQHGDMEAEISPVVTTTSEHVHYGTSMKWDHATAVPLLPKRPRQSSNGSRPSGPGSWSHGLGLDHHKFYRRHDDNNQLHRSSSNITTAGNGSSNGNEGSSNDAGAGVGGASTGIRQDPRRSIDAPSSASLERPHSIQFPTSRHSLPPPTLGLPQLGPFTPTARSSSLRSRLSTFLPNLSGAQSVGSRSFNRRQRAKHQHPQQQQQQQQQQQHKSQQRSFVERPSPISIIRSGQQKVFSPPVLMLSTSMLWSVPNVMLQRKNRNAVLALMAATTGNNPGLVRWLIQSFADIKIAHILQALMIACDQGFVNVVKELVGVSTTNKTSVKDTDGDSQRLLLRRWLTFQHQKIVDHTSVRESLDPRSVSPGQTAAESGLVDSGDLLQHRLDSFPFIFLMEMSPILRHYFQILNTLSSCQFMTQRRPVYQPPGANAEESDSSSDSRIQGPSSPTSVHPPRRVHRCQQQRQQQQQQQQQPSRSHSQRKQRSHTRRPRSPQETKQVLIRILLQPILETFGSISFRRALDKIPRDCWWPLDYDVRLIADHEARKSMVTIATSMNQAKKERMLQEQQQQHDQGESIRHDTPQGPEIGGQGTKAKWYKLMGQRIQKWMKLKKVSKTEEKSDHPQGSSKSFFRRLSFAHVSTNT
ncbi:hypothetical protein BGX31_007105 [Mortierella sp. GBA43]|nr:hypothetical protein BGX31_007105 [Mortierella sp. GBA43]